MTFHLRNSLPEQEVKRGKIKAVTQSKAILEYFREHPQVKLTPFEVSAIIFGNRYPITSIRRAMTNLTVDGELEKLSEQKVERYGVSNNYWTLAKKSNQMELL